MNDLQGSVHSVQLHQERSEAVLCLVIKLDSGEKVPVEMRGYEVRGVLEVGDQINIRGRRLRDRDGVIRPREVGNLTSNSKVTVRHAGIFRRFFGFVFSLTISIVSGVATSVLTSMILTGSRDLNVRMRPGPGLSVTTSVPILPILLGIGVGLFVFYLIFLRRRAR